MTEDLTPRRVSVAVFVGLLVVQFAWIIALPPYRGIDEVDHVYKAVAVAAGQWTDEGPATDGRGGLVEVPTQVVEGARPVCEGYDYTGPDNCWGRSADHAGDRIVATSAAAYNPVYYLLVGPLARLFHGDGVLFAIRVQTAVICALLLAWASYLWARASASPAWATLAILVGITPVVTYSTAIASPNGVNFSSAALLWASLAFLARATDQRRSIIVPATVASVLLLTTHTAGPMWLALILLGCLPLVSLREWWFRVRRHGRSWLWAMLVIGSAAAFATWWVEHAHPNALGEALPDLPPMTVGLMVTSNILWLLQAIAAFPTLNEHPPTVVYALWGMVLAVGLVLTVRRADRRELRVLGLVGLLVVAVPTFFTVMTYSSAGIPWQGRYTMPLWLGVVSVMVLVDKPRPRPPALLVRLALGMLALATAVSIVWVAGSETERAWRLPVIAHVPGGLVLLSLLCVLGVWIPWMLGALGSRGGAAQPAQVER